MQVFLEQKRELLQLLSLHRASLHFTDGLMRTTALTRPFIGLEIREFLGGLDTITINTILASLA